MGARLYIVLLRRPGNSPNEMRSDPFWEFGSFGLTGCHNKNLLSEKNFEKLNSGRLAFVQGGNKGFKLLLITPPLKTKILNGKIEVIWKPKRPFKYSNAPIVINNKLETDFQYLGKYYLNKCRPTPESKFASAFRSRTQALDPATAEKIMNDFDQLYRKSKASVKIKDYTEALPKIPPKYDRNRLETYKRLQGTFERKC